MRHLFSTLSIAKLFPGIGTIPHVSEVCRPKHFVMPAIIALERKVRLFTPKDRRALERKPSDRMRHLNRGMVKQG